MAAAWEAATRAAASAASEAGLWAGPGELMVAAVKESAATVAAAGLEAVTLVAMLMEAAAREVVVKVGVAKELGVWLTQGLVAGWTVVQPVVGARAVTAQAGEATGAGAFVAGPPAT